MVKIPNSKLYETLVWFDVFNWPLTKIELQKYATLKNLASLTENIPEAIENFNGFYFLKERKDIAEKRISYQKIAIKKIKIAKRAAKILSFIPFLEMATVCNDLAYFNAPKDSDIDFFIVAKAGRIWTVRFFSTIILFFLGMWRHGRKIKNRICLSFFLADDNLNLGKIAYDNDVYLKFWILQILPLFDKVNIYQKFLKENRWTINEFPNFFPNITSQKIKIKQNFLQGFFEKILNGRLGNYGEKFLKTIQLKIMKKKAPYQENKDIIISDKILKFHKKDRRKYFKNIFEEKLNHLLTN